MNLKEGSELTRSFARDFAEKEVVPYALAIERDGIPSSIMGQMADRGYLGALAPEALGGAAIDEEAYLVLLETLAGYSPSLAYFVFLQNSIVISTLLKYSMAEGVSGLIESVASGSTSGTFAADELLSNDATCPLSYDAGGNRLGGRARLVSNPAAMLHLVTADGGKTLLAVKGGATVARDNPKLGFRGIGFAQVEYSATGKGVMVLDTSHGTSVLSDVLADASRGAAAVALGIAEGAMSKAVEYSGSRKTFNSTLASYGPVAFSISQTLSELEMLRHYLYSTVGEGRRAGLAAKVHITDAALRASRLSMQVHGGNGYFEDYQVEKYYRDAMSLQVLTGNRNSELVSLSRMVLGEGSATL